MAFQIIQIPDLPPASTVFPTDLHVLEQADGTKKVQQSVFDTYNAGNFIRKNVNDTTSGTITGAGFISTSSIKYKENIKRLTNELSNIAKLAPSLFDWKKDSQVKPGQSDVGLMAEEVAQVYPLVVSKDSNGKIQGVDYSKLSVYLIAAISELASELQLIKQNLNHSS
jgi:hypothetical protein